MRVAAHVPHEHRNDGDKATPRGDGNERSRSVKHNPLGGGPGSGTRFIEALPEEERARIQVPLCAFLQSDYALFSSDYAPPEFCAEPLAQERHMRASRDGDL